VTVYAMVLGALFGIGLFLLARAVIGIPAEPVTETRDDPAERVPGLADRFEHLGLRIGCAVAAAVAIGVLTGWPVGVLLAGAGGFTAPSLLGGKAKREAEQAHLDAIATWTEQLRDVMAAAAGLEQAIITTSVHAPPPSAAMSRGSPRRSRPARTCAPRCGGSHNASTTQPVISWSRR
jgi:hypothetical protein